MKRSLSLMLAGVVMMVPGLAAAQTGWVDYEGNPVVGPWEGGYRYVGTVIEVDGTFHMYFFGNPEGHPFYDHHEIDHATSADGVSPDHSSRLREE